MVVLVTFLLTSADDTCTPKLLLYCNWQLYKLKGNAAVVLDGHCIRSLILIVLSCTPSGYELAVGRGVGAVGFKVGLGDGELAKVGLVDGLSVGRAVGRRFMGRGVGCVGRGVGRVGRVVGIEVGMEVGLPLGCMLGCPVGLLVGMSTG